MKVAAAWSAVGAVSHMASVQQNLRDAVSPQALRLAFAIAAATASHVASNASGVKPAPEGSQFAVPPPASV